MYSDGKKETEEKKEMSKEEEIEMKTKFDELVKEKKREEPESPLQQPSSPQPK